jgi:hypothetical protein
MSMGFTGVGARVVDYGLHPTGCEPMGPQLAVAHCESLRNVRIPLPNAPQNNGSTATL